MPPRRAATVASLTLSRNGSFRVALITACFASNCTPNSAYMALLSTHFSSRPAGRLAACLLPLWATHFCSTQVTRVMSASAKVFSLFSPPAKLSNFDGRRRLKSLMAAENALGIFSQIESVRLRSHFLPHINCMEGLLYAAG